MAENLHDKRLQTIFNEAESLFYSFYESGCIEDEISVSKSKQLFQEATNMVSQLDIFSSNETEDDLSTENIRYLLLPAYLGIITSRFIRNIERLLCVEASLVYCHDFLNRCKSYKITNIEIPEFKDSLNLAHKDVRSHCPDLQAMALERERKIERYRQMKERKNILEQLKIAAQKPHADDEVKREYNLKSLEDWIDNIIDEVNSLNMEKTFLTPKDLQEKLAKNKGQQTTSQKPLQTFIIAKNAAQKKVFGVGYKNIPTMTIDEFYEKEIREGRLPDRGVANAKNDKSLDHSHEKSKEEKQEQEEELDDPEILRKNRAMDDWKDEHKRGWGNKKNRS